jgi:hypothetical protein
MAEQGPRNHLFRMFVGALFGFAISLVAAKSGFLEWMRMMPVDEIASTFVAFVMLFLGAFALTVGASPGIYRRVAANYREGDPLDRSVLRTMRLNALVLGLSGALLLAPPFAMRFGAGEAAAVTVAAAMGLVLLALSWIGWREYAKNDELTRAVSTEANVASFMILTVALFGWASLVKLGLVPEISSWSLMTIAVAVHLTVQMAVAMRRGMFA